MGYCKSMKEGSMNEETLRKEIEIKLLWLSHTLTDNEKNSLEECVLDLILGNKSSDGERERIAFNKGMVWATEYLTQRKPERHVGINCMTGQEWYKSFSREVGVFTSDKAKRFVKNPTEFYNYMMDAAKKVSNN